MINCFFVLTLDVVAGLNHDIQRLLDALLCVFGNTALLDDIFVVWWKTSE